MSRTKLCKGDVWLVSIPEGQGHEQSGTRPAVVMAANEQAEMPVIVPLTSNHARLRFPYTLALSPGKENGLAADSVALVFQLRAVDRTRLLHKIGELTETERKEIDALAKDLLGL